MEKNIKILIVEDEILIALMIKKELEKEGGFVCSLVTTGEGAIKKAAETEPDVILLDIRLAGDMDGIEAARHIINVKPVPIIFMTGYTLEEYQDRIDVIKPVEYLKKPVNISQVIEAIHSI